MESNYQLLIKKLDHFIKKYYQNELFRGLIYWISVFVIFLIIVSLLEYYGRFDKIIRSILFYSFIVVNLFILIRFVVIPLFQLLKIGKSITHKEAALIIGKHFEEVEDKLTNILQLKELADKNEGSKILITESINQKTELIKPVPFLKIIDFKTTIKYFKYSLIPILIITSLLIVSPNIITEPTTRIVKYNTHFEVPMPFKFHLLNKENRVLQNEDFLVKVRLEGKEIPSDVYINTKLGRYKLQKQNNIDFEYKLKNLNSTTTFFFEAGNYRSEDYKIDVINKPIILNFGISLNYPSYIGRPNENIANIGDITVPEGTSITWKFHTRETESLNFRINDEESNVLKETKQNLFSNTLLARQNLTYAIIPYNRNVYSRDSMMFNIIVVKDEYPIIEVQQKTDSINFKMIYFKGEIADDYGFKKLTFNWRKTNDKNNYTTQEIKINNQISRQTFYHYIDLNNMGIDLNNSIEYFFEIWDNDAVNGSKSSKTEIIKYRLPDFKELQENLDKNYENINKNLVESLKEIALVKKEMDAVNQNLYEKENMSWEDKQKVQSLLDKYTQVTKNINSLKKEMQVRMATQQQMNQIDPELLEKQKMLQEMFDKLITDDIKELLKKIEDLMQELNKDELQQKMDEIKLSNKDIEKELDRSMELFKQLEFENKINENIEMLKELAEKQKELSEKTLNKKEDKQNLTNKQSDLEKRLEEAKDNIKKLEEMAKKLNKNKPPDTQNKLNEATGKMKNAKENINKGKTSNASKNQQEAAQDIEEVAEALNNYKDEMDEEDQSEDYEALRQILYNLLKISFAQEKLMLELNKTAPNDPRFNQLVQEQKKIQENSKMVEDSLFALSKRQIQIGSFINKEITNVQHNMQEAINNMTTSQSVNPRFNQTTGQASARQQYAMTSINNLALLLNESLERMHTNMQMKNQSKKSGEGKCNKPGGGGGGKCNKPGKNGDGKKSMQNARKLQEALNKQLEELQKRLEQQKSQKGGKGSMSEELVRMAAQQEAIRKLLNNMQNELKQGGQLPSSEINKMMQEMEQTEKEILNKIINHNTMFRQEKILTKLLEAEKAEKERDMDEKRESKETNIKNYGNPKAIFEYNNNKKSEIELFYNIVPQFNQFYKNKVNEYLNNIAK